MRYKVGDTVSFTYADGMFSDIGTIICIQRFKDRSVIYNVKPLFGNSYYALHISDLKKIIKHAEK